MRLLYACAFLMDAASSAMIWSRSPFGMVLGASSFELGLLGTAAMAPYIVSTVLFGRLSDRLGRRRVVLLGVVTMVPLIGLMPEARTVLQFGCLLAAWSFMLGAYWPPVMAWIGDLRPAGTAAKALGWFNVMWSGGVMVGFLLSGLLFEVSPALPFRFSLACCCLIVVLLVLAPRPRAQASEVAEPQSETGPVAAPDGRFLHLGWLANGVAFLIFGTTTTIFPKLAEAVAPGQALWAWVAFALAASRTVGFALVVATVGLLYRPLTLLACQASLAVAVGIVAFASAEAPFMAAFALLGFASAFTYSWSLLHSVEGQARKGRTTSYHESILRAGDLCGAFAAGFSAQHWGVRAPYLGAMGVAVLGVVAVGVLSRRRGAGPSTPFGRSA